MASDASKSLKAARRLRMTKAEQKAVEYYIGTGGPKAVDDTLRRLVKRHGGVRQQPVSGVGKTNELGK